jgi:prepilin signal peptidase PulO-like enzyme (type II secretory pathway)
MTALLALVWAGVFAGAAWGGARAGEALCSDYAPHADGPRPIAHPVWPFPLAGAAIGLALGLQGDPPIRLAVLAFAVVGLAGCTAADLRCGMLPDILTLAPLALAVGAGFIAHDPAPAFGAAFVAVPYAGAALLSRGRGLGWGDVKLAALGGALLGAGDATLALMLAAVAAYLVSRRSGRPREPVAFGPYLAGSIVLILAAMSRA